MNLDERIESAWKDGGEQSLRELFLCNHRSQVLTAGKHGFTAGYRAAMRSLYVEVTPEGCKERERYWIDMNEELWEAVFHLDKHGNYFICTDTGSYQVEADEVSKILKLSIPSPAEIFGNQTN